MRGNRRSGGRVFVAAIMAALIASTLVPAVAHAEVRYAHTRYDPNDVSTSVDIRSTKRSVLEKTSGKRILKIVLRGYEHWPNYPDGAEGVVKLDTRGGPVADARLRIRLGQDYLCILMGQNAEYDFEIEGNWAACKVPFTWLGREGAGPTKQIRWKVKLTHDDGGPTDHAPNNRGWYP